MPFVRQLHGYDGMWEMRVRHSTGAYRLFFGMKGNVIAVATGERKTDDDFPPAVYKRAKSRLDEMLETIADSEGGSP